MHTDLDRAILDALAVPVPDVPLAAIHNRERAIAGHARRRREALALAVVLLSCAGVAVATAGHPRGAAVQTPVPVASLRPAPTVT